MAKRALADVSADQGAEPESKSARVEAAAEAESPLAVFVQGLVLPELWPPVPPWPADLAWWSCYELRTRIDWHGPVVLHLVLRLVNKAAWHAHTQLTRRNSKQWLSIFGRLVGPYARSMNLEDLPLLDFVGIAIGHATEFASPVVSPLAQRFLGLFASDLSEKPPCSNNDGTIDRALAFGNSHILATLPPGYIISRSVSMSMLEACNAKNVALLWESITGSDVPSSLTMLCLAHAALPVVEERWPFLDMAIARASRFALNAAILRAAASSNTDRRVGVWVDRRITEEEDNAIDRPCRWTAEEGLYHPTRDTHI